MKEKNPIGLRKSRIWNARRKYLKADIYALNFCFRINYFILIQNSDGLHRSK